MSAIVFYSKKIFFKSLRRRFVRQLWEAGMAIVLSNKSCLWYIYRPIRIKRSHLCLYRDILAKLSNDEALLYGRQTRIIVHRLRAEIIDVNEEMKALNRWT